MPIVLDGLGSIEARAVLTYPSLTFRVPSKGKWSDPGPMLFGGGELCWKILDVDSKSAYSDQSTQVSSFATTDMGVR